MADKYDVIEVVTINNVTYGNCTGSIDTGTRVIWPAPAKGETVLHTVPKHGNP